MVEKMSSEIKIPSTRFVGSKRSLSPWIENHMKQIEFSSALDAFGGTASISYVMKRLGKEVYFNDYLGFAQDIGEALISNNSVTIEGTDIDQVTKKIPNKDYMDTIQRNFKDIYYTDAENRWLDITIQNILDLYTGTKQHILLAALYQACLTKRPFNLFHRKNLYLRTNDVNRSFGNKTTWDAPFDEKFREFIEEYNNHIFDNGRENKVIGGYDALDVPKIDVDLVYLDPPYVSKSSGNGPDYLTYYHFLEGLRDYYEWEEKINYSYKTNKLKRNSDVSKWGHKTEIENLLTELIEKYSDKTLILSYRKDGIPSVSNIRDIFLAKTGQKPRMEMIEYSYTLSQNNSSELLFIKD